jgi:hypothetical protein
MVFTERVRIGIPSRDEIQELESNVMDLERLASRSATASLDIEESVSSSSPILPSALTRRRRNATLGRSADASIAARQRLSGASRSSATSIAGITPRAVEEARNAAQQEIQKFNSRFLEATGFALNPVGGATSRALSLGAGIPGVGIAATLAPIIYQMIVAQHGAGGIFDVTKQTLDETRSFIGLEREIPIQGGENLFLGNVALRQGIPTGITSNTQDLRDGLRRYTLQTNQFGR